MRFNFKLKVKKAIIVILGIILLSVTLSYYANTPDHLDEISSDTINLKGSGISDRIHINNNWTAAIAEGICTGNGTYSDPYIIKDFIITTFPKPGILVENSNAYLIIENCTIGHASDPYGGIELVNVNNSQIINNDCTQNYYGILLKYCNNNTISGNIASDTEGFGYTLGYGIYLSHCKKNIITENTANYSGYLGIGLSYCEDNIIQGNIANNGEKGTGIGLGYCNNSRIMGNIVKNIGIGSSSIFISGIELVYCENNVISDNILSSNNGAGIKITNSAHNTISGNTISNNRYGIWLWYSSSYNMIIGNIINTNTYYGIYLSDKSNHNLILGNNLLENGIYEEYDCNWNLYSNNGLYIYIGTPYSEILLYSSLAIFGVVVVVILEIHRRRTQRL